MDQLLNKVRRKLFWTVVLGVLVFALAWPSVSVSRTWYVRVDGTGDAPTIQAGIDSAVAGDIVLVGSGTYQIDTHIRMKNGITVMSESGPHQTKVMPVPGKNPVCAFSFFDLDGGGTTVVDGFWVEGFLEYPEWTGPAYGFLFAVCGSTIARNNVIVGNGVGVTASATGTVDIRNNTIVGNGIGIEVEESPVYFLCYYNIIWDRIAGIGNYCFNDVLNIEDPPGGCVNFSQDPDFCGPMADNYFLQSDSPCAPGNSPWPTVGLIGALPVACGTVKVETTTWGAIKENYSQ
jgi:hypothetical protein